MNSSSSTPRRPDNPASGEAIGLSPALLSQVLPFHCVFDGDLRIVRMGPAFAKLLPPGAMGAALGEVLEIRTPRVAAQFDAIVGQAFTVYFLKSVDGRATFKGQMIPLDEPVGRRLLYVCAPVVRDVQDVSKLGLGIKDFPAHDSVVDLLVILQTQNRVLEEQRKLADRLRDEIAVRREAEEAVRKINEELEDRIAARTRELHDAIESISEGFVLWDADDRLVLCNSRYRQIYSTLAEMLRPGIPFEDVARAAAERQHPVPPEEREAWIADRLARHRHPGPSHEQHLIDGRTILVSEHKTSDGGTVGVRTDITELKLIQAQLMQTSKLATLGEMATGIAHEINQPLTIMRMAAEKGVKFLERGGPEHLPQVVEKLQRITQQIDRARAITDHMRTFGHNAPDALERITLKSVGDSALALIREQLVQHGIAIAIEGDDEDSVKIRGNQIQLEQVVLNLLTNARDAIDARTLRDGPGTPRRIALAVGADQGAGTAFLTVHDSGGGIPPAVLDRIFDPFFTTKEVGKGTGLGLSISYGIVTKMGGAIRAENRGDGALFTITIPFRHDKKDAEHG